MAIGLLLLVLALPAAADEAELERRLLELERDLERLEARLFAPLDTRLTLYLELDVGALLELQSVRVLLDGRPVTARLYREAQARALVLGGVDRLYRGALRPGPHRLTVEVVGIGPRRRPYRLALEHPFTKTDGAQILAIRVVDDLRRRQPRLEVQPW